MIFAERAHGIAVSMRMEARRRCVMIDLEKQFTTALLQRCCHLQAAGFPVARQKQQAETYGGVRAVQDYLRRGGLDLQQLAAANLLDQSIEALAAAPEYGALFTDDEVNACFCALCDAGYYH